MDPTFQPGQPPRALQRMSLAMNLLWLALPAMVFILILKYETVRLLHCNMHRACR